MQGLTRAPAAPLLGGCGGAVGEPVFLTIHPMASASLSCPIRQVLVPVYTGSSKAANEPRITLYVGRRGRPVKKPRFLPLRTAQAVARQMQAGHVGTISVL